MGTLANGRGQLGVALQKKIDTTSAELVIYHTWQVSKKDHDSQKSEFNKFQKFVENNHNKKIAFISTKSQKNTWYTHFKQLSEAFLLTKCEKGVVIRLPTFIGRPSVLFSNKENIEAYGQVELISISDAADKIIEVCNEETKRKIIDINGEKVSAKLVRDIVKAVQI